MIEYAGILIFFLLCALVAGAMLWLTSVLGPKRKTPSKSEPFECGNEPITLPGGRSPIRFYIVAMLFILFDIELVFLFPWAVLFRELGLFGFFEMAFFLVVLIIGFVYAWRKGGFEWN